jgi:hypothetical protein
MVSYKYAIFLAVVCSPFCFAQTAQITGRVADPAGAVVASAPVTVTNVESGASQSTESNSEGYFTISRLEPGSYEVAVRQPGFRPVLRRGIVLQVDQTARVDIALELGDVAQSVEITAAAPLIESETSNLGQVVDNKSIVEMPLNGRNAWDLSQLSGGTVYIDGSGDAGEIPVVSIGGSRTMSQSFTLDGGSVQKSGLARAQAELSPMVDAVEEFKIITNNYAAEYGRTAGGVFTAVTKSGTNRLRGTLFHFFRNDVMDARNFFSIDKPPLRYNQFGGTVGGPIRKNKTHFFAALETTITTRGRTVLLTVPDAQRKVGNFANLTNAAGRRLPIYDPDTQRPDPVDPTRTLRDPFPGNQIPTARFDPVAVKAISFYPEPNLPGNLAGANNFNINVAPKRTQLHGTLRLDHQLSAKDRIYGRYVAQHNDAPQANVYPEPAASGQGPATRNISNLAGTYLVSWVRTVNAFLLNDLKFATTSQDRQIFHASTGQGWAERLGLAGVGDDAFPVFRPAGYSILGAANTFRAQTNPGWQIIEAVSYYRGSHSLKAGFEYRGNRTTDEFDRTPGGDFTFAQQGTGLTGNTLTGNGLATMLLGNATAASLNNSPLFAFSSYYMGAYLQDDWKITPRFTLNLGVRYDIEPGRIADGNTQNGFDLNRIHPIAGVPGTVTFAGIDEPARLFDTDRNNIAPRFGFAWRPFANEGTVIRGGFGMFFGNPDDQGYNNSAVLGYTTDVRLVSADDTLGTAVVLRNGIRAPKPPGPEDRTPAFGVGGPIDFYQRQRATPYSLQYNFGIQKQFRTVLVSTQYMANLGRKLTANALSLNQVAPQLVGQLGTTQSRRPYPQFTALNLDSPNLGHSSYHAFLLRVEKRYTNGFQFLFNYTFSKFIDNVDALVDFGGLPGSGFQDFYNRSLDKSLSSNHVPHNTSFNVIYELPFGPRRQWLSSGPVSQVLGGWQISSLGVIRTGPPYGVTTQQNTCECFSAGPLRPDLLRDPNLPAADRTVERWFDTEAFAQPARFLFGTAPRALGRAPGMVNFNVALMKNFSFRERFRLQFRGEVFNALNHANFGVPGSTFGAPTFAVISTARDARVTQFGLKLYF